MLTPKELGPNGKVWPYEIEHSAMFDGVDDFLRLEPLAESVADGTTLTFNFNIKICGESGANNLIARCNGNATNTTVLRLVGGKLAFGHIAGGVKYIDLTTAESFKDYTAHYSVCLVVDTNNTVETGRVKIFVNGTRCSLTGTYPAQGITTFWRRDIYQNISYPNSEGTQCYISDVILVNDTALGPFSFGSFSSLVKGLWMPKKYVGVYDAEGYHLDFEDAANIGNDVSGNGNDFIVYGSPTQTVDTPTNNYCVLNTLQSYTTLVYSQGNVHVGQSISNDWDIGKSTLSFTDGKYYAEFKPTSRMYESHHIFGLAEANMYTNSLYTGETADSWGFQLTNSSTDIVLHHNGTYTVIGSGDAGVNAIIRLAYDATNGNLWLGLNGSWITGDPTTGVSPTATGVLGNMVFAPSMYSGDIQALFGATGFNYTQPEGFLSVCCANIVEEAYALSGTYIGRGNNRFVNTGCALSEVTIDGTTYTNDGSASSVVLFTSCGFRLVSATQNANGTTYEWSGELLYPTKYSNAQIN
jgi:hypothetical protein